MLMLEVTWLNKKNSKKYIINGILEHKERIKRERERER